MRYVYLTSTELRHTAFLDALISEFPSVLIVREPKKQSPSTASAAIPAYKRAFTDLQSDFFNASSASRYDALLTEPEAINQPRYIQAIREIHPDVILAFGCSVLSQEILKIPNAFVLNIHTGITQLFRGVDSAFWAIHERRPEGIGATVHLVDHTIDAGDVVLQARPTISEGDTVHHLFFKSVSIGFETLRTALQLLLSGKIKPQRLIQRGKLYWQSDFNETALLRVEQQRFHVLHDYLQDKDTRDSAVPIISYKENSCQG